MYICIYVHILYICIFNVYINGYISMYICINRTIIPPKKSNFDKDDDAVVALCICNYVIYMYILCIYI
jgi:hypothetical protein